MILEHSEDLIAQPNPTYRLETINPYYKKRRGVGLNPRENSQFSGVCTLGCDQLIECYKTLDRDCTKNDFWTLCNCCSYCNACSEDIWASYYPLFITRIEGVKVPDKNEVVPAFVYFVTDGEFVKIGVAEDPDKRIAGIQTGNPRKLEFLALIPCESKKMAHRVEYTLHQIYRRFKKNGEWYSIHGYIQEESFRTLFNPIPYLKCGVVKG